MGPVPFLVALRELVRESARPSTDEETESGRVTTTTLRPRRAPPRPAPSSSQSCPGPAQRGGRHKKRPQKPGGSARGCAAQSCLPACTQASGVQCQRAAVTASLEVRSTKAPGRLAPSLPAVAFDAHPAARGRGELHFPACLAGERAGVVGGLAAVRRRSRGPAAASKLSAGRGARTRQKGTPVGRRRQSEWSAQALRPAAAA